MFYEQAADREGYLAFSRRTPTGASEFDPAPHFHNSIEFYICESGEYCVRVGGEEIILHAGEIIFVDRYTPHNAKSVCTDTPTVVYCVIASAAYLSGIQWLTDSTLPVLTEKKEGIESIIELVSMAYGQSDRMDSDMKRGFVGFLLGMMKNHCGTVPRVTEKGTQMMVEVMRYIDEHLSEDITLEGLSKRYGYEKTYFSRVFNRLLGMSLREYLNRRRITAALRMAQKNPELPAYKIFESCGFCSANTYYRALKRYRNEKHNF